jgi:ABC-2 type transport system permease protein
MTRFAKGVMALYSKETKESFSSPLIYILAASFCLIIGWLFYNYIAFSQNLTTNSITKRVLIPVFGNMNFTFLFLAPLLTMGLFSEEKKQGTLDLLLSSELTHFQIIMGKFLSSLTSAFFILSLTFVCPIILAMAGYSDWGMVLTCYAGLMLTIMCYLVVGVFFSSLTENQVLAAFLSFGFLLMLMLLVATANASHNMLVAQIIQYLSVPFHFEHFLRGTLKNYSMVYFFSFWGFFFFLTHISLDARKW